MLNAPVVDVCVPSAVVVPRPVPAIENSGLPSASSLTVSVTCPAVAQLRGGLYVGGWEVIVPHVAIEPRQSVDGIVVACRQGEDCSYNE